LARGCSRGFFLTVARGVRINRKEDVTQNSALKKAIRARMEKMGEKYTEARRAVLSELADGTTSLPRQPLESEPDDACRICGSTDKLSFEHVPPKSTGNRERAEILGIEAWLQRDADGTPGRGRIIQRGSGVTSLCESCNSHAGTHYVPEFRKWVDAGNSVLSQLDPPPPHFDAQLEPAFVDMRLQEVRPGRFMKQIVTMLLALSPNGFPPLHPELTKYARELDAVGLPSRYQFYLTLLTGPTARFNGGTGIWREKKGMIYTLELGYPPFSYILTIDEEAPALETGNITAFTEAGVNQKAKVQMQLQLGFSHTPLPLDFRSKAALERDRAANEAEGNEERSASSA
jgi:hypothetical protein